MRTLRYGLSEESADLLLTFLIHMHAQNRQTAVISYRSNSTICYRIVIGWSYVRRCYPVFLCTKMGRNQYGYPPQKKANRSRYFNHLIIRTRTRVYFSHLLTIIPCQQHVPIQTLYVALTWLLLHILPNYGWLLCNPKHLRNFVADLCADASHIK